MKPYFTPLCMALCLAFSGAALAAPGGMSKDAHKAAKDKIEAQYKVDKKACDAMQGNAKDVCQAEAKGKEEVAEAELEAQYKPGARADEKVKLAKADADYNVAKEKCDDAAGDGLRGRRQPHDDAGHRFTVGGIEHHSPAGGDDPGRRRDLGLADLPHALLEHPRHPLC